MFRPPAKPLGNQTPQVLPFGLEPLLLLGRPVGEVIVTLAIQHLLLLLVRFKVQPSSFRSGLCSTNIPIMLFQSPHLLTEMLRFQLGDAEVVDVEDSLPTGAVIGFL